MTHNEIDTELLEAMGVDYPGLEDTIYPIKVEEGVSTQWLSIPVVRLEEMVRKWVDYVETAPTSQVCLCEWLIHPDDTELPAPKQRKKKAVEHPRCPVHTKMGYLLGFFVFSFQEESTDADPS
jgi:hypothetical protein